MATECEKDREGEGEGTGERTGEGTGENLSFCVQSFTFLFFVSFLGVGSPH